MIENIPKMFCRTNDELLRHFEEAFPNTEVMDLRFAYDVNKLQAVHESLKMASSSYHSCLKNKASITYIKFKSLLNKSQFEYRARKKSVESTMCLAAGTSSAFVAVASRSGQGWSFTKRRQPNTLKSLRRKKKRLWSLHWGSLSLPFEHWACPRRSMTPSENPFFR